MASTPETPLPEVDPRRLWAVRVATLVCLPLTGFLFLLLFGARRWEDVVRTLPFVLPYLIVLWGLRAPPKRSALAFAEWIGWLVFGLGGLAVLLVRWRFGGFFAFGALLTLAHAALAVAAMRARPRPAPVPPARGPSVAEAAPGRLWVPRIATGASLSFLGFVFYATAADLDTPCVDVPLGWWLALGFITAPYLLILGLLQTKWKQAGLVVAMGWGAVALAVFLVCFLFVLGGAQFSHYFGSSFKLLGGFAPLLALVQVALVLSANTPYSKLARGGGKAVVTALIAMFYLIGTLIFAGSFGGIIPLRAGGRYASLAVSALRTLNTALATYTASGTGFPASLTQLGPDAPEGSSTGLVESALAHDTFSMSGYTFTYTPGPPDDDGRITTYTLSAQPTPRGLKACRSFFSDHTGWIRFTEEDRPATANDPPLQ